jgi:hypothetical protein
MSSYSTTSPYYKTSFNGSYLDVIEFIDIPEIVSDVEYEILLQHQYRPDLLAFDLYGDQGLWWVFAVRNKDKIKDPIFDLYAGQKIKLPQPETLKSLGL